MASIDQVYLPQLDLMKKQFVPGFIGLNNINGTTDHVTACVHALAHVPHLRDIFLLSRESSCNSDLGTRLIFVYFTLLCINNVWFAFSEKIRSIDAKNLGQKCLQGPRLAP